MSTSGTVTMTISRQAAAFLHGTAQTLNQKKILPEDNAQALETSAWLEEIEYAARKAVEGR